MKEYFVESLVVDESNIYFMAREWNMLCAYDMKENRMLYLGAVPLEDKAQERLFNGMCIVDNKIILAPYNAEKIWIYDLKLNHWSSVSLSQYVPSEKEDKFVGCVGYKNNIYFFGYSYSGIIKLDIESLELSEILKQNNNSNYFWGQTIGVNGNICYVANRVKNEYIKIDMENNSWENIELPIDQEKYVGATYDGEKYVLLPHHGKFIYEWDGSKDIKEISLHKKYDVISSFFNGVVCSKKYILLYSPLGYSYIVDRVNSQNSREWNEIIRYAKYDYRYGFIVCKKGKIELYNDDWNLVKTIPLTISELEFKSYVLNSELKNKVYRENDIVDIGAFISML